jgi:uncharacterized protein (TIGR03437 family)
LFGKGFGGLPSFASKLPLPTTIGDTQVVLNGVPAPLFYTSDGQINLQIPWELAGQSQVQGSVTTGGVAGPPIPISLATFAPAIFSVNQTGSGQGAILLENTGFLAAAIGAYPGSRPASTGGTVWIFATGLGPVTAQPASGTAASSRPTSIAMTTPTVSIGGVSAKVLFSGLAPGFVGLYQINAVVPSGIPSGNALPVTVSTGGVISNTVTMAVQ